MSRSINVLGIKRFRRGCLAVARRPGLAGHVGKARLPLHMLRYWITYNFLREHIPTDKSSRVLEIGIDRGQFYFFSCGVDRDIKSWIWSGADLDPRTTNLQRDGYDQVHLVNFENPGEVDRFVSHPSREGHYDAVVLTHFLEHLNQPESTMKQVVRLLRSGGIVVGGMPGCPEFYRIHREGQILKHASPHGHKSVFSMKRVTDMLREGGLETQTITGAFFSRSRDFYLENFGWWLRFNIWFGRTFPNWPSEIYFVSRKPF